MGKFKLYKFLDESNIFLIMPKESKGLPLVVHGMLMVHGTSYINSYCSHLAISDELSMSKELALLEDDAETEYFKIYY